MFIGFVSDREMFVFEYYSTADNNYYNVKTMTKLN